MISRLFTKETNCDLKKKNLIVQIIMWNLYNSNKLSFANERFLNRKFILNIAINSIEIYFLYSMEIWINTSLMRHIL